MPANSDDPTLLTQALFEDACTSLAQVTVLADDPPSVSLYEVARIVTETLNVERFSVWCTTEDQTAIRLYFLYCRSTDSVADGTILRKDDFPSYFSALDGRTIAVEDAQRDVAALELLDGYLAPLGIGAFLDAPLYSEGVQAGVVCHEHVGAARSWSAEERLFVATVADNVSRLLESLLRMRAEQNVRAFREELKSLNRLEEMARIASGVAHDLRNIFTVVLANAELLEQEPHDSAGRDLLLSIRNEVLRGRDLATELMVFGRDVAGRPAVQTVRRFVEDVVHRIAPTMNHCAVDVVESNGTGRVFIDPTEFERVLVNLLYNARDAMPENGTIRVEITRVQSVRHSPSLGRAVRVSVCDHGVGMDANTRLRIFEPFFTRKPQGTGLGLCVVQQIVTRAGGVVEVDSTPGRGTCVHVNLPSID